MDADIARWILEYLLRQPIDDRLMSRVLSILPISNDDRRLKKTLLLRTIESEISDGSVSEKILDLIEAIAELDKGEGIGVSESMKDAYCVVAVDCTVRFMDENCNAQGKYFDTVKRIWRGRIRNMERSERAGLVSNQLWNWRDEIEAAIWDPTVCENVLMRNTRKESVKATRIYVDEAWKVMGPTFLELAAQTMSKSVAEAQGRGNDRVFDQVGDRAASLPNARRDLGVSNSPAMRDKDQVGKRAASSPNAGQELGVRNRPTIRDKDRFGEQESRDLDVSIKPATRDKDQVEEGAATLPNVGQDMGVSNIPAMREKDHNGRRAASSPNAGQELGVGDRPAIRDKDQFGDRAATSRQDLNVSIKPAIRDKDRVKEGAATLPNVGRDLGVSNKPTNDRNQVGERASALPNADRDLGVTDKPATEDKDQVGERAATLPNAHAMRDKETQKGNVLPKRKHVAGQGRHSRGGVKITDTEELNIETSSNEYDCLSTPEVNKVREALRSSSLELQGVVKDPLPDALHLAETVISDMARKNMNHESSVENQNRMDVDAPNLSADKITDTGELSIETSSNKYDCLPTPEVNKVQEALRSSSLELQAVVKDPLPDALRLAETVISDMARKNMNHESSVENQNRMDVDASNPSADKSVEPVQANEENLGNQCSRHENNLPRLSLMERNGTARTYEWDDSIDGLPEGSPSRSNRPHLPSPKRKAVSPLKKYEITKFARRRKMKKWSVLEEDTLRTGVQKYGKGNWKLILNCYRDIFEERTEVDLKDKWRNMMRY